MDIGTYRIEPKGLSSRRLSLKPCPTNSSLNKVVRLTPSSLPIVHLLPSMIIPRNKSNDDTRSFRIRDFRGLSVRLMGPSQKDFYLFQTRRHVVDSSRFPTEVPTIRRTGRFDVFVILTYPWWVRRVSLTPQVPLGPSLVPSPRNTPSSTLRRSFLTNMDGINL